MNGGSKEGSSMQRFSGKWGFLVASVLFWIAAVWPVMTGGKFNAAFFVLAVVFLVLALGISKKGRA